MDSQQSKIPNILLIAAVAPLIFNMMCFQRWSSAYLFVSGYLQLLLPSYQIKEV